MEDEGKMKVLIFAYACDPNRQSEPGLGWNISREIARRHEVTLVTREKNRAIFEKYLAEHPECPHVKTKFLYHDVDGFWRKFKSKIPFGTQLYFSRWLKTATGKYREKIEESDIVHQLTFCPFFVKPWGVRYTEKYVWGPIGGGGGADSRFPKGFPLRGLKYRLPEWIYRLLSWAVYSPFAIGFKRMRSKVAAITFKARAFADEFPIAPNQISAVTQETGYDGNTTSRTYIGEKHPLKIVAVGRMIPHKAFEYAIRGFGKFVSDGGDGEFHIFGDGPMRKELEALTDNISSAQPLNVRFHGNVPNAEVHAALDSSDVFLHASFIEAAAWSILEAMIHGVPVVCQDRSGMADMVTDECGTRVVGRNPAELIEAFSMALMKYYRHPELVRRHGVAGQERVRNVYTWTSVGEKINDVYESVMGGPSLATR